MEEIRRKSGQRGRQKILKGDVEIRTIKYKNYTAKVSGEKPTECSCCGKTPKARGLAAHHTKYEYTVKEVRENPELAKENTIYLCYACHRVANAMRICMENYRKAWKIIELGGKIETKSN